MPTVHTSDHSLDLDPLLAALTAFRQGDFGVRLPLNWTGVAGKIADTLNGFALPHQR